MLRESEFKYRAILATIEEGYYEVNLSGKFTFLNDSMGKILAYSKEDLLGKNAKHYMDEENRRLISQTLNEVKHSKKLKLKLNRKIKI